MSGVVESLLRKALLKLTPARFKCEGLEKDPLNRKVPAYSTIRGCSYQNDRCRSASGAIFECQDHCRSWSTFTVNQFKCILARLIALVIDLNP